LWLKEIQRSGVDVKNYIYSGSLRAKYGKRGDVEMKARLKKLGMAFGGTLGFLSFVTVFRVLDNGVSSLADPDLFLVFGVTAAALIPILYFLIPKYIAFVKVTKIVAGIKLLELDRLRELERLKKK
jgi:hypothetical protein